VAVRIVIWLLIWFDLVRGLGFGQR
jgi:hypothetical protein